MFGLININNFFSSIFKIPKDTINLGRWNIKSPKQIDYYMTKMHPDPGYIFVNNYKK